MTSRMTRRKWLRDSAALSAGGWMLLADSRSAAGYQANEKLNVALVGVGKRGRYHRGAIPRMGQNLAAVCDVHRTRAAESSGNSPGVPVYQDFREMLDERDKQIDAVVVATPDHTHAAVAAAAMKRGKHVYVEKPMAHDVGEARALRQLARQHGVATQMGNQGMATDSFRRTLELIQEGAVGEIREVHVWYVFGGSGPRRRPTDDIPVPEGFDWNLWLGPAPMRPYHPSYVTGWGGWREYGTGMLGGGGAHSINMAFLALDLGALWQGAADAKKHIRVEAEIPEPCPENYPRWQTVRFDIPARGKLPPARIHWYNGSEPQLHQLGIWQRLEKIAGRSLEWEESWTPRSGSLLVGSRGVVHTNAHNSMCALLPEKDFPNTDGPPQKLPRSGSHEREWLAACRGGPAAISHFDHSGPAVEMLLLGNVATWRGQPLEFDPIGGKIVGDDEADGALRPPRREGWSL